MILLREEVSKKIPGGTSLYLKIPYQETIVSKLQKIQPHDFNKISKEWELPVIYLSDVVKILSTLDEVKLEPLVNASQEEVSEIPALNLKSTLFLLRSIYKGL